ncbi:MAG: hypothetical protein KFF73_10495 [Cyclobacteriaceae bacterium]|nr:hypothetical protein [Cyclobacteriaceae bacterium]
MVKKIEFLKRTLVTTLLAGLALSLAFVFYSCDDDDDPDEPESLAGTYQMQQVVVTEDYKIGEITIIPAGTDVTDLAAGGILAAAPCSDPENAAVDLRDTGTLFLVCDGEAGELQAGTWTENSNLTTLSLNLSSPPFPQNLQLNVINITRTASTITGEINPLTLPGDAIADMLPQGVNPPLAVLIAVEVTFVEI